MVRFAAIPQDACERRNAMTFTRFAVRVLAAAAIATALTLTLPGFVTAHDEGVIRCSDRTLKGDYGFNIDGQILPPGAPPLILRGVAMTHFDGRGGLTQVDHTTLNGVPRAPGWRPGVGSYEVNSDCTGTAEIIQSDGSPTLRLNLVVFDRGRQVRTVVDGNATGSLGVRVN
jgi:hypothetical protein